MSLVALGNNNAAFGSEKTHSLFIVILCFPLLFNTTKSVFGSVTSAKDSTIFTLSMCGLAYIFITKF